MSDHGGAGIASAGVPPEVASSLLQSLIQEGPLSVGERALFLRRRWSTYVELLLPPGHPRDEATGSRLRLIANDQSFEDLQALLGRRGDLAAAFELELYNQEKAEIEGRRHAREAASEEVLQ